MKKLLCVVFLMLLLVARKCFYYNDVNSFLSQFDNILSIQLTYPQKESSNIDGVFNGNSVIVNVKNLDKLDVENLEGIAIKLNLSGLDICKFIDNNNIHIDNKYMVFDNIVYDCHFKNNLVNGWKSVQIVIEEDVVILGIPSVNCF